MLNPHLVEQQQLNSDQIRNLEVLHLKMQSLHNTALQDIKDIPSYVNKIKHIEFAMQHEWGFTEDSNYHTHWYMDPKCTCPILDNHEAQGTDRHIINMSCPLHGDN